MGCGALLGEQRLCGGLGEHAGSLAYTVPSAISQ